METMIKSPEEVVHLYSVIRDKETELVALREQLTLLQETCDVVMQQYVEAHRDAETRRKRHLDIQGDINKQVVTDKNVEIDVLAKENKRLVAIIEEIDTYAQEPILPTLVKEIRAVCRRALVAQ